MIELIIVSYIIAQILVARYAFSFFNARLDKIDAEALELLKVHGELHERLDKLSGKFDSLAVVPAVAPVEVVVEKFDETGAPKVEDKK